MNVHICHSLTNFSMIIYFSIIITRNALALFQSWFLLEDSNLLPFSRHSQESKIR